MKYLFGYKIYDSQYPQMKIIETPKFILRPATLRDVNDFYEYFKQEKVVKYLPFKAHKNITQTKTFVRNFCINNVSPNAKKAELGICVNPQYWGHDFSTQLAALSVISGFEFTTLDKLVVITYSDNKYTPKCINALKFEYIKTFKPKGNKPLSHVFELKRSDYLELKKEYLPTLIKQFS